MEGANIKYAKNVLWLRLFVESASKLVPLSTVARIRGYRVREGCKPASQGGTTKVNRRKYSINILLYDTKEDGKKHRLRRYYHVLETLAHELAHIVEWEHDDAHFKLTAQILQKFSAVLSEVGITDTSKYVSKKLMKEFEELYGTRDHTG
jgi:hypothetical protein